MKFEVEEMRKKLFEDDRNEFLMKSIFKNIQNMHKYGHEDPIVRQTGRTTLRVLEGLHEYKTTHVKVVYFIAHKRSMAQRLVDMFEEYRKKLGITLKNDSTLLITKEANTEHDLHPAIYVKDHSMP